MISSYKATIFTECAWVDIHQVAMDGENMSSEEMVGGSHTCEASNETIPDSNIQGKRQKSNRKEAKAVNPRILAFSLF
jgi:hypothetical protein